MRAAARAIWPCLALALGASVAADGAARAEIPSLASHRAVYKLALASVANGIAGLSGRMAIEIVDVCDGWTLEQRIGLRIVSPDGPELESYTSFTSWEAKDGTQFRFEQETKRNGVTVEELGGRVELEPGKAGVAKFTKPEEIELPLPAGTLFPSRHTALLIERALEKPAVRQFLPLRQLRGPRRYPLRCQMVTGWHGVCYGEARVRELRATDRPESTRPDSTRTE